MSARSAKAAAVAVGTALIGIFVSGVACVRACRAPVDDGGGGGGPAPRRLTADPGDTNKCPNPPNCN
ncbi:hypothetical protein ACWEQL_33545 [Kitasatospora sp. NPDC004240]